MSNRKKAAKLFIQSRKVFYQSESTEKALDLANNALAYLSIKEITPHFAKWVAFLYSANQRQTPPNLQKLIPDHIRFVHIKMQFLIQDQRYSEAIKIYNKLTDDGNYFKQKKSFTYYELISLFFHAEMLFHIKKRHKAFEIISSHLKLIDESNLGEKTRLVLARAYIILGEYYQKRGMVTLAEAMMRKAFMMIEDSRMFFVTADLYIRIADFYVVNFPHAKGLNLLERLSQISDFFPHKKLLLKIEMQWLFYYIYSGNTEEFWIRLQDIKEKSRQSGDNKALANIYYLEAMFHFYNKDMQTVDEHVQKALALKPTDIVKGKCKRLYVANAFMLGTQAEGKRRLEALSLEYHGYGFNKFVDFYKISDKEELETLFIEFFKQDMVWKEEILLSFYGKFTKLFPELFQNTLKRTISDYKSTGLKLSIGLLNEALGKSYLKQSNFEEARFYLNRAQTLYKKNGYLKAAKLIDRIIPANEMNLLELRTHIENYIYETENTEKIQTFQAYKRVCDNNLLRLNAMREILEFSNQIDITDNTTETLKQVLYWISSLAKAKSSVIMLIDEGQVKAYFEINFGTPLTEKRLIDLIQKPNTTNYSPLNIKRTYIIDETKTIILYLRNDEKTADRAQNHFLSIFLKQVEPIITLFVKNTLYLQNSMYDSLTGLYSRWYYEERFREEFEKALRYKMPISYIIGDIDSFKLVNDTYGHQTGDEILKEISRIFLKTTRKFDIVARYGGEEFSIILPNTNVEGAVKVAEKIRTTIEEIPIFPFNTSMSFGIDSMEKEEYDDFKELERRGDIALYIAKKLGKNRVEQYDDHNNELNKNAHTMIH
ncbi:MAG: GGDEF domain-containing protein [Thermotogota bacterium]